MVFTVSGFVSGQGWLVVCSDSGSPKLALILMRAHCHVQWLDLLSGGSSSAA